MNAGHRLECGRGRAFGPGPQRPSGGSGPRTPKGSRVPAQRASAGKSTQKRARTRGSGRGGALAGVGPGRDAARKHGRAVARALGGVLALGASWRREVSTGARPDAWGCVGGAVTSSKGAGLPAAPVPPRPPRSAPRRVAAIPPARPGPPTSLRAARTVRRRRVRARAYTQGLRQPMVCGRALGRARCPSHSASAAIDGRRSAGRSCSVTAAVAPRPPGRHAHRRRHRPIRSDGSMARVV